MIFISRFRNFKLGLRSTSKQVVNNASGSEDVVIHPGVTVVFNGGMFDTKNWEQYTRPESPDKINTIRSEADLIRQMKASPFFNVDFSELTTETPDEKRARLLHELAQLDAETGAIPSNGPDDSLGETVVDEPHPSKTRARRSDVSKPAPSKKKNSRQSRVDL